MLVLLLLVGVGFLVMGALEILSVAFADEVLSAGDGAAGLLVGATGIGGLVGAGLATGLAFRARLAPAVVLGLLATAAPLALMGQMSVLVPAVVLLAVCGIGEAVTVVAGRTLLQRVTDDEVLARVFAVQEAVMLIGLALGAAIAPVLVTSLGAAGGFVPLALGLAVAAIGSWGLLRKLDGRAHFRPDVLAVLRRVPFLAAMSPPDLERLVQGAERVDLPAGTVVIQQGDRGDAFYVVDTGSLTVDVDGVRRGTTLEQGDGFGEIALLQDVPRTATITAVDEVGLLRIERDDFLAAITGSPDGRLIADEVSQAHLRRDEASDCWGHGGDVQGARLDRGQPGGDDRGGAGGDAALAVSVCAPAELIAPLAAMPGFVDAPTGPLTIPTTCRGCTHAVVAPDAVTRHVRMASASAPVPYAVSESWYEPAGTASVRTVTYPPVATSNPASCAEM